MKARIVILNYRGSRLLPLCLPGIVKAAGRSRYPVKVTVLNNPGPDDGLDYVERTFEEVEIWRMSENRILCAYNDYLRVMKEPVAVLLNNDIRVEPDFLDPLLAPFESRQALFMTAPRVMSFDGASLEAGASRAGFRFGHFWCSSRWPGWEQASLEESETFSSGFGAVDRRKFLELGGYDPLFKPGIMEDVDLSLRASRRGYELRYIPSSVVYHVGQASFRNEFRQKGVSELAHRNTYLYMWKNYQGWKFWAVHLLFLPFRLTAALLSGKSEIVRGWVAALNKSISARTGMKQDRGS